MIHAFNEENTVMFSYNGFSTNYSKSLIFQNVEIILTARSVLLEKQHNASYLEFRKPVNNKMLGK
jgi:hypothetical protein